MLPILLGLIFSQPTPAEWPQWRGASHDLHSTQTGLAQEWPQAGPPVLWNREFGAGYSSFVGQGDRVFTLMQTVSEQAVVCLNATTGETIWSVRYDWPFEAGGLYPGPRSTPLVSAERLYFTSPDGSLHCLRTSDGSTIWKLPLKERFRGRGTDFGYAASPVLVEGKIAVPIGGEGASVVAVDASSGEIVWKAGDDAASYCSLHPISFAGRTYLVALLENVICLHDATTGEIVWRRSLSHGYDEHSAGPIYREPDLFFASPFKLGGSAVRLESGSEGKLIVNKLWDTPKLSNDVAPSVLIDEAIYGFDLREPQSRLSRPSRGEFRCLDWKTGEVLWSDTTIGHAVPIAAEGMLIFFNDRGEIILGRPDRQRWIETGRIAVFRDEVCWSLPSLHRGRLYLRTHHRAVCFDLRDPKLVPEIAALPTAANVPLKSSRKWLDPVTLIGAEREYPATPPEDIETRDWYVWSLFGIALAALLALIGSFGSRFGPVDEILWWSTLIVWGALVGRALNLKAGDTRYLFLWPLLLWTALQATLDVIVYSERQTDLRRARYFSRAAGLALLVVGGCYFYLCRLLGLALEWSFLASLVTGFPLGAAAAHARHRIVRPLLRRLLYSAISLASFSVYYWASIALIAWRSSVPE